MTVQDLQLLSGGISDAVGSWRSKEPYGLLSSSFHILRNSCSDIVHSLSMVGRTFNGGLKRVRFLVVDEAGSNGVDMVALPPVTTNLHKKDSYTAQ